MLEFIWGFKTVALLDVWTIEHVMSGLSFGHAVLKNNRKVFKKRCGLEIDQIKTKYFDYLGVLFIAYLWEAIEHYLEAGLAGEGVAYWFQGVEFWGNRLITDPLMLLIGYHIAKRYPQLVIPARVFSIVWLFVHIFVFPHSMVLQELL